jgi:hypothetical protein
MGLSLLPRAFEAGPSGTGVEPEPAEAKRPSVAAGFRASGAQAMVAHVRISNLLAAKRWSNFGLPR